jgi:uncharacterized protein YqjF (DUF2071 family)
MHPALQSVAHRPWPLPAGPWVMAQSWHDLLFAHWAVAPPVMRAIVPRELELDLFEGQCWVGVVPFWMSGVRVRGLPAVPGVSQFAELNVRTYVTCAGKQGVYFFSLDAASRLAVAAARAVYHLPYCFADMSVGWDGDTIVYRSTRCGGPAEFRGRYGPVGPVVLRRSGSLEHWLSERYCLYTVHHDQLWRGEIHHGPWPLQDAFAEIEGNTVARAAGIDLPDSQPVLHFAKRLDVLIWRLVRTGP